MTAQNSAGPALLVLTAAVARRYYIDGKPKVEIAEEFKLSRFQVARLIESARSSGMVRIEISQPGVIDVDLSDRLQEAYGLRHSVVVDVPDDQSAVLRRSLGRAAADLLMEILTPDDVLGLAWARSVSAMAGFLTRLPPVPIVQLTGALSASVLDNSSIDLMREVAKVSRGPAYIFYAPMMVRDAATAKALRQQPEVVRAFAQIPSVTRAVVGIGSWGPGDSTVYDAVNERTRRKVLAQGACADIAGLVFDGAGAPVLTDLTERVIGIDPARLRAVPEVIAIPYGTARVTAVLAVLAGRTVDSLVTHSSLARLLLDHAGRIDAHEAPTGSGRGS